MSSENSKVIGDNLKLSKLTKSIFESKYVSQYRELTKDEVIHFCNSFDKFIITNLLNYYNNLYWFIYYNIYKYNTNEKKKLIKINKSKKIITLLLCNQKQYIIDYENFNIDENITLYYKKYVVSFVKKNKFKKLVSKLNHYNENNDNKLKYITKRALKKYSFENINLNEELNVNHFTNDITLTFGEDFEPHITFYKINEIFNSCKNLNKKINNILNHKYKGLLIYEDAINTETNLIDIIYNINELL